MCGGLRGALELLAGSVIAIVSRWMSEDLLSDVLAVAIDIGPAAAEGVAVVDGDRLRGRGDQQGSNAAASDHAGAITGTTTGALLGLPD